MTPRKGSWFNVTSAFISLALVVAANACSTNSDSVGALGRGGSGGGSSVGGASGPGSGGLGGAAPGSGGAVASGGVASTGGVLGTGGLLSSGGSRADSGVGGSGGRVGDAGVDGLVSVDGSALAKLCLTTGGQVTSGLCCASVTEFPSSCTEGACGCAPTNSHTIPTCTCPGASCFSQTAGCIYSGNPGTGGTGGALDGGQVDAPPGTGGAGGSDGGKLDLLTSSDATSQAELCTATGGQVSSGLCCGGTGDFPNSCLTGACGCSPSSSHTVATCACPGSSCFVPSVGCTRYTGETDAASAQADGNGCTARPDGDATFCGGTKPAHYYACIMTMLTDPCAIVSIGDVTNTFCCP